MKQNKGFTLIETMIYSALISMIIGMILVSVYQLIIGNERIVQKNIIEEEANFLLKKIEWGLNGVSSINSPAPGASSSALSINKLNYFYNPVIFDADSGNLRVKKGSGNPAILNSQNVSVNNVKFQRIAAIGNAPEAVKIIINVNQRPYQTTIYLKK